MNAIYAQIKELIRNGVNVSIIMNIITLKCTCAHKILHTHTYIIIQTFILSHQQRHNNSHFHPHTPTQPHTHTKLSTWTIGAYMDMHTHNSTNHTHIGKLLCI
jgi:hypothetical protein